MKFNFLSRCFLGSQVIYYEYLQEDWYGKINGENGYLFFIDFKSSIRDGGSCEAQLGYDYYKISCPNVENTVRNAVLGVVFADPTAPAAFLRLLFHDCQVQGQVSCADIIALAAKVSVALSGGPNIQIPLGRKDSTISSGRAADANVTVDTLLDIFTSKGLNLEESVAIMGAHTLGGHCINIVDRLFDWQPDDPINPGFKAMLRLLCPTTTKPLTNLTIVPNDKTPLVF